MKIWRNQLEAQLNRPVWRNFVVTGEEVLLVDEVLARLRRYARDHGAVERSVWDAAALDWDRWQQLVQMQSLFADRRLVELRLGDGKLNKAASGTLEKYLTRPNPDVFLLISAGRLTPVQQRAKWARALEAEGLWIQVASVAPAQFPRWIQERLAQKGMRGSPAVVQWIAERSDGNLLACAQEIEKLFLLYGPGRLTEAQVAEAVADNARFSIYRLVDAALEGEVVKTAQILRQLQGEGVEPVLVLWALCRDIRVLAAAAQACRRGRSPAQAMAQGGVWEKRKPLIKKALDRFPATAWHDFLEHAARIDRLLKGVETGNCWHELLQLALRIAGGMSMPMPAARKATGGLIRNRR